MLLETCQSIVVLSTVLQVVDFVWHPHELATAPCYGEEYLLDHVILSAWSGAVQVPL